MREQDQPIADIVAGDRRVRRELKCKRLQAEGQGRRGLAVDREIGRSAQVGRGARHN